MSLWNKPLGAIAFQDVDEFCKADLEESVRLDYKADSPADLAKIIAAMANTVGGMILLGVDANKTTNKPIWPPIAPVAPKTMLKIKPGISEQIYQLSRDSIYPPIMPEALPKAPIIPVPNPAGWDGTPVPASVT